MRLLNFILVGALATPPLHATEYEDAEPGCVPEFGFGSKTMDPTSLTESGPETQGEYATALRDLTTYLPQLFPKITQAEYYQVLKHLLTASLVDDGGMIVTSIIGPASMGKSTITNAIPALASNRTEVLPEDVISQPGREAGLTKRSLILMAKSNSKLKAAVLRGLRARFGLLDTYVLPDDPTRKGQTLVAEVDGLNDFPLQVFIDTPDMTTGDPQRDLGPVNQKSARNSLLSSEIFLIILNDENLRDYPLREMLMENFRKYGMRKSIFILKTDAETPAHFAESRAWLLETVRSIYGFQPNQTKELHEAVLGMYAMPKKRNVRDGKEHPQLVPFDGSDYFPNLMHDMGRRSDEIRGFAGKKAAELVVEHVGEDVDGRDLQRRVKTIYAYAIREALNVGPAVVDFPFEEARRQWRKLFTQQKPTSRRYLTGTANLAGVARKILPKKSAPESDLDDVLKSFDSNLKASWLNRINAITGDLKKNQVRLPEGPAKVLRKMITTFNELHPNHQVTNEVLVDTHTNIRTVSLPPSGLLAPTDLAELATVFDADADDVLRRMTETPKDSPVKMVDVEKVSGALRDLLKSKDVEQEKVKEIGSELATAGTPTLAILGAGGFLFHAGLSLVTGGAATAGLLAAGGLAALISNWREQNTDKLLKPKIDEWFKAHQVTEFKRRLDKYLLHDAYEQLEKGTTGPESIALDKVRNALKILVERGRE